MGEILLRRITTIVLIVLVAVVGGRHYHRIQWFFAVDANEAAIELQGAAKIAEMNASPTYKVMERVRRMPPRTQRKLLSDIRIAAMESRRLAAEQARRQAAAINRT